MKSLWRVVLAGAALLAAAVAFPGIGYADTFNLQSCHVSGTQDTNCQNGTNIPAPGFGSVTLTQDGTSVDFTVSLINGNRFVETGAGGEALFLFNDTIAGSTITTIAASPNTPPGGLSGFTNLSPVHADGTGDFTAAVECTVQSECQGGGDPAKTTLTFVVTNATVAQLETANAKGNFFVADIFCGTDQTQCNGLTGPVDVHPTAVPAPLVGAGLPGFIAACIGLVTLARRRRKAQAVA